MTHVKKGDTIKVHYTGKLLSGEVFDSSLGRDPLEFTVGSKMLIPGFEDAVLNMKPGDSTTIIIPCDQAYGARKEELVITVKKSDVPPHLNPQIGQVLQFRKQADNPSDAPIVIPFTLIGMTETELRLDANHPLAGQDLMFDIELVEIL
jgi:peptidylprolyl isomerase